MNAKIAALIAGFVFISLAIFIQGIIPATMKESQISTATKTVRTHLGELEDVSGKVPDYDTLITRGRSIFLREGCWYCHSMYVRPVAGEERRWGPISQAGEYAHDTPHTFGTRRIGPDLTRVGGKYGDDWHNVHFFDARIIVPDSIMPKFSWFYNEKDGLSVLNEDGKAITAFIQQLGMSRGKWRDDYSYQIATSGSAAINSEYSLAHGKEVYLKRCEGCHGEKGDGKGPASPFFTKVLPRDFTSGTFKFRTTPSGSLPLDSDIYRTITVGVRGTAMPPWANLPEKDRWDVVHYIKTFSDVFKDSIPDQPIYVPPAPKPDETMLARGAQLYMTFQCNVCHGDKGHGDGPSASSLDDEWGNNILPADFTTGIFKVGPRPEDIYRTMTTGLNGTPMPSYGDAITEEDDHWALAYFILSLSADEK